MKQEPTISYVAEGRNDKALPRMYAWKYTGTQYQVQGRYESIHGVYAYDCCWELKYGPLRCQYRCRPPRQQHVCHLYSTSVCIPVHLRSYKTHLIYLLTAESSLSNSKIVSIKGSFPNVATSRPTRCTRTSLSLCQ